MYDWDWRGAEASLKRALEVAPDNAQAIYRAGALARSHGRNAEAIQLYRQSLEKDPLNNRIWGSLARALLAANRFVEAEAAQRSALELNPQAVSSWSTLSLVLLAQGRGEEALAAATREPDEVFRSWARAIVHHGLGQGPESDAALEELTSKFGEDSAFQIAEVHGARGETDAAFEWLERAYAQRDSGIPLLLESPSLLSLQDDPRWAEIVRRVGLEG